MSARKVVTDQTSPRTPAGSSTSAPLPFLCAGSAYAGLDVTLPDREGALDLSYLRVSTKDQAERGTALDEGFSIPAQREASNARPRSSERSSSRSSSTPAQSAQDRPTGTT